MQIDLTKEELKILYKLVVQSNWNGQMLEQGKELKDKLGSELEQVLDEHEEIPQEET